MLDSFYINSIYEYEGLWGIPSKCGLKIVTKKDYAVIVLTELAPDNPGTSVTNFSAPLATKICHDFKLDPNKAIIIEHNPDKGSRLTFYNESFFHVKYEFYGTAFQNPKWEDITKEEVDKLLEEE